MNNRRCALPLDDVLAGKRRWHVEAGDAAAVLGALPSECIQTVVTSPPYWALRDYQTAGQLGLERTPEEYIDKIVDIFREVRRVLRSDGTLWLNLGDTYAQKGGAGRQGKNTQRAGRKNAVAQARSGSRRPPPGLKPKDMVGIPWMVAFALRADGWWLRRDIIWHKPNVTPENVDDRPTTAHEYLFLLTKSADYFYDKEAIKEPVTGNAHARGTGVNPKAVNPKLESHRGVRMNESFSAAISKLVADRNRRSVWTVPTRPGDADHFATYPPELVEPCILAGTAEDG